MKKSLIALNAAAAALLSAGIMGAANVLAYRHPERWDLTQSRLFTLSDKTARVLASLENPVEIAVFYQPNHSLYKRVFDLLREYAETAGEKLKIEYVDPDRDAARTRSLAERLKVDGLNTVVVSCGGRIQQVSDADLVEYDFSQLQPGMPPKIKAFKGEEAVTSAILTVTQARRPRIYFLTGHGEKQSDSFSQEGIAALGRLLEKNNMEGEKLLLAASRQIPADADLVVVAGPSKPVSSEEVEILKKYVEQGGAVWAMADPLAETGLEPLFAQWGVAAGKNVVVDPSAGVPHISAANLFIGNYTLHPIVCGMTGVATLFTMTRSVDAASGGGASKNWRVTPLARTTPAGWGETNVLAQTFAFNEKEDLRGPVSIAVAIEPEAGSPVKGRAVVVGDSEFCTNTQLPNIGNADFAHNILQWLLGREKLVSLPSKTPEQIQLHLSSSTLSRLFWLAVVAIPLAGLFLGFLVWLRRRK